MFEQAFNNIDNALRNDAGCDSELDYIEQTSWVLFLKYLHDLEQYVRDGVSELDDAKLPNLIELKYNALANAKRELGSVKSIRDTFIGFQEFLYAG